MAIHNLPSFPTPFIGRTAEIPELSQLLDNLDCRLLTLVGPGGIGKTRLAVEIARRKLDTFPDGVYFVPLQPLQSADQVLPEIISVLPLEEAKDPQSDLLDYLHEKRLLLVLDNFEHVLESAPLVSDIVAAAPKVCVLATSREVLNLRGEWVRQVDGLTYPDENRPLDRTSYSAIDLFADCVQRVRGKPALDSEYEHVVRICQLVGGMPLGIELAAAWLRVMPSAAIAEQIQHSQDILTSNQRDRAQRHQSIRAVFDQSWQMLTPDEQAVYRRLSVFQGGFTLEAAAQVAGAAPAMLADLVDKSLVRMDDGGRYSLHEVLHQYAAARLEAAGENDIIRQSHCNYYTDFLQQCGLDLKGGRQPEAAAEFVLDFANIYLAWLWMVKQRNFDLMSHSLECLCQGCLFTDRAQEFWKLCQAMLDMLPSQPGEEPHPLWGKIIVRIVYILGDETLQPDVERSLALARKRNDVAEIGQSLWALGYIAHLRHDAVQALSSFEECLDYHRQLGDPFYIADALIWTGACYSDIGHFKEGYDLIAQSLRLRQEIGDKFGQVICQLNLSNREIRRGNYALAEEFAQQALTLANFLGYNIGRINASTQLALIYLLQGNNVDAQYQSVTALKNAFDLCARNAELNAKVAASLVASLSGDLDQGRRLLEETYRVSPVGMKYDSFWLCNHWGLAITNCAAGDDASAIQYLSALHQHATAESRIMIDTLILPVQVMILARDGDKRQAAELLGLALNHPKHAIGWMEQWALLKHLRDDLEAELGEEAFAAAWECGAERDLETTVADFLTRFGNDESASPHDANGQLTEPLTERELDVLALLAEGHSNRQIAEALVLSPGTVRWHIHNLRGKLEASNRTHAVARAREAGLL